MAEKQSATEMTIAEAIKAGYEYCGTEHDEGVRQIKELDDEDILDTLHPIFLSQQTHSSLDCLPDASTITEYMCEDFEGNEDGCEQIQEILTSFEPKMEKLIDEIKEKARGYKCFEGHELTKIRLVQEKT